MSLPLDSFCDSGAQQINKTSTFLNLSPCAQYTLLVWAPFLFFLSTLPFFIAQCRLNSNHFHKLPYGYIFIAKLVLCAFLVITSSIIWLYNSFSNNSHDLQYYDHPFLRFTTFFITFFTHLLRQRCGLISSGVQHLTSMIFLICEAPELYYWVNEKNEKLAFLKSVYYFWYLTLFVYTFSLCFADKRKEKKKAGTSAEFECSFLNQLTLWWFNSVPWIGSRRDLELDDIYELDKKRETKHLYEMWKKYWEPKRLKYKNDKISCFNTSPTPPSIAATFFQIFTWDFLFANFLLFLLETIQFASPYLLQELLNFISSENEPFWKGLAITILMFSVTQIRSFLLFSYIYIMFGMANEIQTTLMAAVYNKVLVLSNEARRDKTVGEIMNLMSIDVEKIKAFAPQVVQFWSCPYQMIFALVYLYVMLGYSALPGVFLMILFIPINILPTIIVKKWQVRQMKLKDERTKIVNEVLNGIKVVKLYAWEIPMEEHIENIRNQELKLMKKIAIVRNLLDCFNTASPFLVAFFSFGTFVLSNPGHMLTPQVAFVSLTLFNILRFPMDMLATLINQTVQALVSNDRLKNFLVADELDDTSVTRNSSSGKSENSIKIENFTASWEEESEQNATLRNVNMTVPRGSLTMIVGKVGHGKSSLLQAILGEMGKLKGKIVLNGEVAYIPQQPWIQNMSLRDNITFGKAFNKKRYDEVISACALKADIKILPAGDLTEIGEKGINLSGGQKARVSLARAVYQNLDVYLLDDPLSAVDAHVGKHIFEKVIGPNGLLKEKTRVLVTHSLKFTHVANEIVVMKDGCSVEVGTYSSLVKQNGLFFKFLEDYKSSWDKEQEELDSKSEESSEEEKKHPIEDETIEDTLSIMSNLVENMSTRTSKRVDTRTSRFSSTNESTRKLILKEKIGTGHVKPSTYVLYMRASTKILSSTSIALFILFMTFQTLQSFWLSDWSNEYNQISKFDGEPVDLGWRLSIYGFLGIGEAATFFFALFVLVLAGQQASKNLHSPLIHNLMRSPMSFYDTTPLGRILNRCTNDIEIIDMLPVNLKDLITFSLQVLFTLLIIIISTPLFIVVIIPLGIIYSIILKFYVPTSRQLKRMESVNRSPIYSHFGQTIQGASSIRAFNRVYDFRVQAEKVIDTFFRCRFANFVANRWLALRLEFLGNCIILFAALFAVLSKELGWVTNAGIIGVSVSYALNITEVFNMAVRQISDFGANIVAVERVDEYTNTPTEAEWRVGSTAPPADWPTNGVLKFDKYSTRYREGLDFVLRDVSVNINAGDKIGIVGRTGAGKSSFALALFRMIEPASGRIIIDGVDVAEIGLHDLRSHVTIIPQDPVLFYGTLRFNLDPFSTYSDAEIWRALELAHLKDFVLSLNNGLLYRISEAGDNLSVGQRQLVALARALLRHTKLLVLDEATAAIDVATDLLIQETIRKEFNNCTVCTIAHRLNTIMDYDKIMVLDNGKVVEFDSPSNLMANKQSAFSKLVADTEKHESG